MRTYIKLFTNELKNKGLSLYDKAVFGSLVTKYQYHECTEFYTYEAYIADELEISESTVKRSIKTLSSKGLIKITKKYHKQLQKTVNYYSIPTLDINTINDDRDDEIEPLEIDTTPVEIMQENVNNEPINEIEEINTNIDSINVDETFYKTDLQQISINNEIENYDIVDEVIQIEYNQTAEEYFSQFDTMFDLGSSRLEHISDLTRETDDVLTPNDVLNVFKAIKKKQAA